MNSATECQDRCLEVDDTDLVGSGYKASNKRCHCYYSNDSAVIASCDASVFNGGCNDGYSGSGPVSAISGPTAWECYSYELPVTDSPSRSPTRNPTGWPSFSPTTASPTNAPSSRPTRLPSNIELPSPSPTMDPSSHPSATPSRAPSQVPTSSPSMVPTVRKDFSFFGNGWCSVTNSILYDRAIVEPMNSATECQDRCLEVDDTDLVGSGYKASNKRCHCYYNNDSGIIASCDASIFNGGCSDGYSGSGPVSATSGPTAWECYSYGASAGGSSLVPTMSPTKKTGSKIAFTAHDGRRRNRRFLRKTLGSRPVE
ncbi:MAG: hypothetical protein SGBAC_000180 [Bacillariaceae sp.]